MDQMESNSVTFQNYCEAIEAFEEVITPSFGPCGGHALINTNSGQCLVSKDGQTIMESCIASTPVKSWIKDRIRTFGKSSGDGSKSFVLITSELLRRVKSHHSHHGTSGENQVGNVSLKSFCMELVKPFTLLAREAIPSDVLKTIVDHPVCFKTSFCDTGEFWEFLIELIFSTLQGNLAKETARFLSSLVVELVKVPHPELQLEEHMSFVVNNFVDFCQDVGGYSVADSYVMEGVLIQRDFAHLDLSLSKRDSDINVVLVACDFQVEMQAAAPCMTISTMEGVSLAVTWNETKWRGLVDNLKALKVTVVISVNVVPDALMARFRLAGVSVIHSVNVEDLDRITAQTGIPLNYDILENMTSWTVHKVSFLRRVVLGRKAFCCAGFRGKNGLMLKHLILCGPTAAVCRSQSVAVQNSLKMAMMTLNEAGVEVVSSLSQSGHHRQMNEDGDGKGGTFIKQLWAIHGGGTAEVFASSFLKDLSEKEENKLTQLALRCFEESLDIVPRTLHNNSYQVNHGRFLEGKPGSGARAIHAKTGHWIPPEDVGIIEPLMNKLTLWQEVLEAVCDLFRIDSIVNVKRGDNIV